VRRRAAEVVGSLPRPISEPVIVQRHGAFSLYCRADVTVHARAERIWELLTDARGFARWNSTVSGIEGEVREGGRLRVHVPGTDRVFTPRVSDVVKNERMTWTGGFGPLFKGIRTFELQARAAGTTGFTMAESFTGLLIPLVRRSMPDFGPIFARYVDDLRRAAEQSGWVNP